MGNRKIKGLSIKLLVARTQEGPKENGCPDLGLFLKLYLAGRSS